MFTIVKLDKSHTPNFTITVRSHHNIWSSLLVELHFTDGSILLGNKNVAIKQIKGKWFRVTADVPELGASAIELEDSERLVVSTNENNLSSCSLVISAHNTLDSSRTDLVGFCFLATLPML